VDGLSIPRLAVLTAGIWGGIAGVAWAGTAPVEPPTSGALAGPVTVATGTGIPLRGSGVPPGARVTIELAGGDALWRGLAAARADSQGTYRARVRPRPLARAYRLRALVSGAPPSRPVRVRSRDVTLDAVGDINLGDRVAEVMRLRGARFPWSGVARELRSVDVALGNLECAVSTRGRKVPNKQYNFRGHPGPLREAARYAGMDVLNMANNHTGDFGSTALLDTVRWVRRFGMTEVGAGSTLAAARRPRIVERLGLRIAFVGFSDINPAGFGAGPRRPGTVLAGPGGVRADVRRARRMADVVVASFHWGVERASGPSGRQRALARAALGGGAAAVIGSHPHVLQPTVRRGRRVVAYSLGNFVWSAGSGLTSRTGILRLRLSTRGVEGVGFLAARISGTRPALLGRRAR